MAEAGTFCGKRSDTACVSALLFFTFFFGTLFQAPSAANAQDSLRVTGRVVDSETDNPLPGVHVFYTGTTIGDVTDENGHFGLRLPPLQQVGMVISMLGFEIQQINIDLRILDFEPLLIELRPITLDLGAVSVVGDSDHTWRRNLKRFESIIFGDTDIGRNCEIVNPTVIDLDYWTIQDLLDASANEPVIVENRDLGYQIEIHGMKLRGRERNFTWSGEPVFKQMETGDEGLKKKWRKNRLATFRGSLRHFIAALHRGNLKSEGFGAYHVADIGFSSTANPVAELRGEDYDREKYFPVLTGTPENDTRQLEFFGPLLVMYNKEHEPENYIDYAQRYQGTRARALLPQSSWIELPFATLTTDSAGNVFGDSVDRPVRIYGFWAWERLGEWLPSDYIPEGL